MASAGIDGAVYEWQWTDSHTLDRLTNSDHVFKSSQYESVVCGPKGKSGSTTMVCAGKDGVVRELESGTVSCEIKTELGKITQLISSKSDRLMLVGTQDGTLRAYEQPLDASQENVDCSLIHR